MTTETNIANAADTIEPNEATDTITEIPMRVLKVAHCPPRHNSCRFNRTKNLGGGDEGLQWHDTDKHSRTER